MDLRPSGGAAADGLAAGVFRSGAAPLPPPPPPPSYPVPTERSAHGARRACRLLGRSWRSVGRGSSARQCGTPSCLICARTWRLHSAGCRFRPWSRLAGRLAQSWPRLLGLIQWAVLRGCGRSKPQQQHGLVLAAAAAATLAAASASSSWPGPAALAHGARTSTPSRLGQRAPAATRGRAAFRPRRLRGAGQSRRRLGGGPLARTWPPQQERHREAPLRHESPCAAAGV